MPGSYFFLSWRTGGNCFRQIMKLIRKLIRQYHLWRNIEIGSTIFPRNVASSAASILMSLIPRRTVILTEYRRIMVCRQTYREFICQSGPWKKRLAPWNPLLSCANKNLDDNVGQLMSYLEERVLLKIIVVSFPDHGDMARCAYCVGSSIPIERDTNSIIVRWPGRISAVWRRMLCLPHGCDADIMLFGRISSPDGLDGVDFSRVLLGKAKDIDRDDYYLRSTNPIILFQEWRPVLTKGYN